MARRWAHICARAPLAFALLAANACALDVRELEGSDAGNTAGSAGSSEDGGRAGTGSSAPTPAPVELPVCSYSMATEPGCDTMVDNAGFAHGIDGWLAEPLAIRVGWNEGDADGSDRSGSIAVQNSMYGENDGVASGGGWQCVPASPGDVFDMAGDIFIPDGQGAADELGGPYVGRAGFSVFFSSSDDCSDHVRTEGSAQTRLIEQTEAWVHVEGSARAPATARSLAIRALTVKPFKQVTFKALFDNVLLKRR